ncbi:MAG: hypothetical protein V2I43_24740 [Parvularcula sp.]|jgi:hypothetical protein|nr:hypothetical protein [Parvularcula sp.]
MRIRNMVRKIALVADDMLPEPPLPDTALAFAAALGGIGVLGDAPRECRLDPLPPD